MTYNLKLQGRFFRDLEFIQIFRIFRYLEFQPPPLKHTYSLDVKVWIRVLERSL